MTFDRSLEYFELVPTIDAAEYLARVEASGWTEGWTDVAKRNLGRRVRNAFASKDPLAVCRALARVSLLDDGDAIVDVGAGEESYCKLLKKALAARSFGGFHPKAIVDEWVLDAKIRDGVFRSRLVRARVGDPIVVSFVLGQTRYAGVFASGNVDGDFLIFVNEAIAHAGGSRFFIPMPLGDDRVPRSSSIDCAYVTRRAFWEAVELGLLPSDDYVTFPSGALPAGSIHREG